ncbi:TetR/AcrR family transcriptional regulator [Pseudonocardiaceae bacterium YIM PH 21723]|nr:TetR/AcrR family transcriptional regulator [Pseudonocardiaceae bacterium YIM PH 21723]
MPRPVSEETPRQLAAGAADMLRHSGLAATTIRDVAKRSGAPLGSTYHYFPGGKDQLVTAAVRHTGDTIAEGLRFAMSQGPVAGVRLFLQGWRAALVASDCQVGCPVLVVAVESTSDELLRTAADVFGTWRSVIADGLREHLPAELAEQQATVILAAVEGATAMCRAQRDIAPFDHIVDYIAAALEDSLSRLAGS